MLVAGKGTNKKTTLYVGGLEESVNEATLHSAFIPFGDIKDVNIPLDNTTGKHRGFGFVEYEVTEVSVPLLHGAISHAHGLPTLHAPGMPVLALPSPPWVKTMPWRGMRLPA